MSTPTLPQAEFWERYNKRLEFPLSTIAAVLLHVVVGALVVFILARLMGNAPDRASVPLILVQDDGEDDTGRGTAGDGGEREPVLAPTKDPFPPNDSAPLPPTLPNVSGPAPELPGPAPLPPPGGGQQPRQGVGKKGPGKGGAGDDTTRARNQRWTIRFKTADARDYLNQLARLGAEVLVPVPGEEGKFFYFPDLSDLSKKRIATDDDKKKLAGQVRFCDNRSESARELAGVLGLDFAPKEFWAFFPKELEDDMDRKERGYANRQPERIERTFFRVVIRDGKYELVVDEQRLKK